jgi:signal transduction histidine kinase
LEDLRSMVADESCDTRLTAIQTALQGVIRSLRTTAVELRSPTLAAFGLEKAIRSHADGFQQAHPELTVNLDLDPDGQALPERVRLALYRIYQNGLANVVRHAGADCVDIRLRMEPGQARLEVQDNGQGFIVPPRWIMLVRAGHLGLAGASERAEAVGGRLEVESSPGAGTLLRVVVPAI